MDISQVAKETVALLTPLLPHLIKAGDKAIEAVGAKVGNKAWTWGAKLWETLWPKAGTRSAVKEAIEDVSRSASDEDAQGALRQQLKKLLTDDPALARELAELLADARADGLNILASGDRSVAAETIHGSAVVPGDDNTVVQVRGNGVAAVGTGAVGVVVQNLHLPGGDGGSAAAQERALVDEYLEALIADCVGLKVQAIRKDAVQPGQKPVELNQVYVDLDLELTIAKQLSLREWLAAKGKGDRGSRSDGVPQEREQRRVPLLEALAVHPTMVLLGAPGSGKSTFVAYVALSLAQARIGALRPSQRLGDWWEAEALLPVRVVLRKFGAWLPAESNEGRAGDLWGFLNQELEASGRRPGTCQAIQRVAHASGAMFLLDGLDEARDAGTRGRILAAVTELVRTTGAQSRFLLTSRPYAWRDVEDQAADLPGSAADQANGYPRYAVAEFAPEQMKRFIGRWFQAVHAAGWIDKSETDESIRNLQSAIEREEYGRLARNPLLLTLMATLLANHRRLPEDRADLYEQVVDLLLRRWNEAIGLDRGLLHALQIESLKLTDLRPPLEHVAYEVHAAHQGQSGVADIAEAVLVAELRPMLEDQPNKVDLVLDYIEQRAGLLLCQGPRKGLRQYTFPHRTFQEFLAACDLKDRDDFTEESVRLAEEAPSHWREVLRFAARLAGPNRGVTVADALVHSENVAVWTTASPTKDRDWERAVLAGEQLLEIGLAAVVRQERHRTVKERVAGWLAALLDGGHLPVTERAAAGMILARLGDPRPGVGLTEKGLPHIDWIDIPAEPFLYGHTKEPCELIRQPYRIAKYPVTVAQYQAFVEAGGYGEERYWTKAGWAWRTEKEARGPDEFEEVYQAANHPRVGVSWYEAVAFCAWLSESLGRKVELPTEAQWERAARHTDGREFPWGNKGEPKDRCNMSETGIDHTSAVGMFPNGKAECGALDMAGNVWEWCRTKYRHPGDESLEGRDDRVLRGGAFDFGRDGVRCAYRDRDSPGNRYSYHGFRVVVSPF